jgi:hypothetical protein
MAGSEKLWYMAFRLLLWSKTAESQLTRGANKVKFAHLSFF